MATFKVNESQTTEEPLIKVETRPQGVPIPPRETTLLPGRHRFQLVVVDDQGKVSQPAIAEVIVFRSA